MIFITFIVIAVLNFNMIVTFGLPPYLVIKQVIKDIKKKQQMAEKLEQEKRLEFNQNRQRIKGKIESIKRENFYDESQEIELEHTKEKKIIKKGLCSPFLMF